MKKKTSPVFWLALVAVAVALFVLTEPKKTTTSIKAPTNKRVVVRDKNGISEEDLKAVFPAVNIPARNAFMPLVVRSGGISVGVPNGVPAGFVDGDGSWSYTGTVEVDGVRQALFENKATGESVFLRTGERWKSIRITRITSDSVSFSGPLGTVQTLRLVDEGAPVEQPQEVGIAPLQVTPPAGLQGGIGMNNVQAVPETTVTSAPAPATAPPVAASPMGGGTRRQNRALRREQREQQRQGQNSVPPSAAPPQTAPSTTTEVNG